jgi:hypothetical protein
MVMVITFLTLTNIAIGYALAVYVQKHFGTLIYQRGVKAVAEVTAPVAVAAVSQSEKAPAPVATPTPAAPVTEPVVAEAPAPTVQAEVTAEAVIAAVEVQAESDTVDEENVLAGIEEFRSQLAKMSENTTSEAPEQAVGEPQQELVGAAN